MNENDIALCKELRLLLIYFREHYDLYRAEYILRRHKSHGCIVFCYLLSDIRYYAEKLDARLVLIYAADLVRAAQLRRIGAAEAFGKLLVFRHGMTHEIKSGHLLFESEQFASVHLLKRRHLIFAVISLARHCVEEAQLTVDITAAVVFKLRRYLRERIEHLAAVCAQPVERSAFYETLDSAFVELLVLHPLAERIERCKLAARFSLALNLSYKARADILDGEQSEIYLPVPRREALGADIDMGRHDLYAEARALRYILRDLRRIVEHAADKRRHELAGIVALEPRRFVGDKRIRCCM